MTFLFVLQGLLKCLELKTGFENYYTCSSGKMSSPFQKQINSPYNQHQLQLATAETHKELNIPLDCT